MDTICKFSSFRHMECMTTHIEIYIGTSTKRRSWASMVTIWSCEVAGGEPC